MGRVRQNFLSGTLSAQLLTGGTSMSSAELASLAVVAAPDVVYLTIDPDGASPEIVKVTAHSAAATSATIVRAQDGTSATTWASSTAWRCTVLASDWSDTQTIIRPTGDASGSQDYTALSDAITDLTSSGGTIFLGPGTFYINASLNIPNKVNIWGSGDGEASAATTIRCTASGAQIAFGIRSSGHRGGVSGNFTVHGTSTATQPIFIGQAVERTFINMESIYSAAEGMVLEGAQNCTFVGCKVSYAATIGLVWDYSCAANRFYGLELDSCGTWHLVSRQSGTAPSGLASTPFDNQVHGAIMERTVTEGCINQTAGDLNSISDCQIVHAASDVTFNHIKIDSGTFSITNGLIQSNNAGQGTAITAGSGTTVNINGTVTINGVSTALSNSGTVNLNGHFRVVSASTYLSGTAPVQAADYGYTSLGSLPCFAAGSGTCTTSLAAVGASYWTLNPANYVTAPSGRTLQYRMIVTFQAGTNGDVFGALMYDNTAAAGMFSEVTATKVAGSDTTQVVSGWQTFPASVKGGYIQVRNQTGARGTIASGVVEIRIA